MNLTAQDFLARLYRIAGTDEHPERNAAINVLDAIDNGEIRKDDLTALMEMFDGACR